MDRPKSIALVGVIAIAVLTAGFMGFRFLKARTVSAMIADAIRVAANKDCTGAANRLVLIAKRYPDASILSGYNALDRCFWSANWSTSKRIEVLESMSQGLNDQNRAVLVTLRSSQYYDQKNCSAARTTAEEAVRLNPRDAKANAALGAAYFCEKDYKTAREWYQKALDLNPNDAGALNSLGAAFALDTNPKTAPADHIARAKELFDKAIAANPDFWKPYLSLAYYNSADPKKALEYLNGFRRAYEKSRGWPPSGENEDAFFSRVEYMAGDIYARLGMVSDAKAAFNKFLELGDKSGIFKSPEKFGYNPKGLQERIDRARTFLASNS